MHACCIHSTMFFFCTLLISSDCIKWINALYNFPVKSTKITDKIAVCVASLKRIVHVDKI